MGDMKKLSELLLQLIELLKKNQNQNWANYFSACIMVDGKINIENILQAYGGMCSFNDFSLSAYQEEVKRQELSNKILKLIDELKYKND